MKYILSEKEREQEIRLQEKIIETYKYDELKRPYVKEAFKQLNNAKNGFVMLK